MSLIAYLSSHCLLAATSLDIAAMEVVAAKLS